MVRVPHGTNSGVVAQEEMSTAKRRLLDATIDYVAEAGLGELSLRQLAAAIGTSHRMLIYHFGSKEELLVDVVREVERRERASSLEMHVDAELSEGDQMRRRWKRFSDPRLWPQERLFFDVYARALRGDDDADAAFLEEVLESWVAPIAAAFADEHRVTATVARADARLHLAVVRGLLLDLLATEDRAGVNRAYERFIALWENQ
jgi:AcrR family transcriptional regulator